MKETDFAEFECEVNKPKIPVKWLIDGVEVVPSPKYQIFAEEKVHRLAINKTKPEDEGQVTCEFKNLTTTANLYVIRKYTFSF